MKIENKQINFDVGVGRKTGKKKGRIITKDSNKNIMILFWAKEKQTSYLLSSPNNQGPLNICKLMTFPFENVFKMEESLPEPNP